MYARALRKPDGRSIVLYGRDGVSGGDVPVALRKPSFANPHLRWHVLRGEWVVYAAHRDERTFLPPADWDPLAPSRPGGPPTEVPAGDWEVAVFENRFPSLLADAHDAPPSIVDSIPARGVCEVVVYGRDAHASLATLPLWHVELLFEVWADRTRLLGERDDVAMVFPFENRGVEVGATLRHPHGQIYGYPFVPPILALELSQQHAYREKHGRGLLEDLIARETSDGRRMVYGGEHAVAFVPACARWAYEVWIAPRRPVRRLDELEPPTLTDLARALKTVLLKYDALERRPLPYVMVIHQAPNDGRSHPEAHLHLELYPPVRTGGRLKYLAGSELGAGVFTSDTLPEAKAAELRSLDVVVD